MFSATTPPITPPRSSDDLSVPSLLLPVAEQQTESLLSSRQYSMAAAGDGGFSLDATCNAAVPQQSNQGYLSFTSHPASNRNNHALHAMNGGRPGLDGSAPLAASSSHQSSSIASLSTLMERLSTQATTSLELPMICVMGDTSSGKSSLLSQLSGVELPAAHTLTTKCPILLQLSQASKRQAQVSIQWRSGNPQPSFTATLTAAIPSELRSKEEADDEEHATQTTATTSSLSAASSPSNSPKPSNDMDGGVVTISDSNWDTLPQAIAGAQELVLRARQTEIASDVVVVKVQGPHLGGGLLHSQSHANLPPLTLIDLPGLVRTKAQDESDLLIPQARALLDEYLSNKRCILLPVVPANVDFHNSQILSTARRVDPQTLRTMPVITKPDLIDAGAESNVVDLLLNRKVEFCRGFHMVKCRGQAALDQQRAIERGIDDETNFFSTTEPWKGIMEKGLEDLFGTARLRAKLGQLQLNLMHRALPSLLQELEQRQASIAQQLQQLGQPFCTPLERRRHYQDVCQSFVYELKSSLSGKGRRSLPAGREQQRSSNASLRAGAEGDVFSTTAPQPHVSNDPKCRTKQSVQLSAAANLHKAVSEFAHRIQSSSLATIQTVVEGGSVLVTSQRGDSQVRGEVVHVDDAGFACVDYVSPDDADSKILFEAVGMVSQNEDDTIQENDVWSHGTKIYIARRNQVYDALQKIPLANIRTNPEWLRNKIAASRTDDLACFLNVDIFKNIVADLIEDDWKPHCITLLNRTREILQAAMDSSIQQTLAGITPERHAQSLQRFLRAQCQTAISDSITCACDSILQHLEVEKHPYTSLSDDLFRLITQTRQDLLMKQLERALRLDQEGVVLETQAIRNVIETQVFARNQQVSLDDFMAEEMELVLGSYGMVATKRILDRIPMICWHVVRSLATTVEEGLWTVTDAALERDCLAETPAFARQYEALSQELQAATRALGMVRETMRQME